MGSRRRFRPRPCFVEPAGDRGTKGRRPGGRPSNPVGASREGSARGEGDLNPSGLESTREKSLRRRDADVRTVNRHRWARRAASGERVKPGQGTRHTDPVTSEEGMPVGVKASRRSSLWSQRIGPSDCLAKTQVRAKPRKAPYTH
jgi:hypothetical protein